MATASFAGLNNCQPNCERWVFAAGFEWEAAAVLAGDEFIALCALPCFSMSLILLLSERLENAEVLGCDENWSTSKS